MKTSRVNATSLAFLGIALLFGGLPVRAQDARNVTEPGIPPACTVLNAQLTAIGGKALSDADETKLDTKRIQDALDHCRPGQAVKLAGNGQLNAFLAGPLQLRNGITLQIDGGAILFGSRNPRDYDVSAGSCGVVNTNGRGCKPLIGGDRVQDAAVMGDGTIDGRGGAALIGQQVSWWDLAQEAKVKDLNQNCPRILALTRSENFILYGITLKNSPNFHVVFGGNGFTAWGVIIDTPKTARNTDGIVPMNATNVTITRSYIHAGDDQVVIKASNSDGPSSRITVAHNHFYAGHGMSIGSETDGGVSAIRVTDLSIDGSDNGLRIKSNASRGGLVRDVVYEDVCIRDTKNPILMDTHYTPLGEGRNKLPRYQDIVLRNVRILSPGKITLDGYDETHRLGMTFDNVFGDSSDGLKIAAGHARISEGPGQVNFPITGEDVRVEGRPGKGTMNACDGKFVPMPNGSSLAAKTAEVEYTVPAEAEIKQVLDRIREHFVRSTPYQIINTKTGTIITDLKQPIKDAGIDMRNGEYNDWTYSMGVVLAGMIHAGDVTGDRRFLDYAVRNFDFIFSHLDYFRAQAKEFGVQPQGYRRLLNMQELDDNGAIGAALIKAYDHKRDERYRPMIDVAADFITHKQFRMPDGTLARQRPQPVSVWADDFYMSVPFLAQMGQLTHDRKFFDDAAKQVIQMSNLLFDPRTGLYDHSWYGNAAAYDPRFYWGRGAGWALMATAELLSVLPEDHPDRSKVLDIFQRAVQGVAAVQSGSGLWHQLLDKTDTYLETSGSAMFTFAIARGVNRGWLAPVYAPVAQTGWQALARRVREDGQVEGICVSTTAAYDAVYYYNRPTDLAAMQGYGPMLMAGAEVITMLRNFDIQHSQNTFHYRPRKP